MLLSLGSMYPCSRNMCTWKGSSQLTKRSLSCFSHPILVFVCPHSYLFSFHCSVSVLLILLMLLRKTVYPKHSFPAEVSQTVLVVLEVNLCQGRVHLQCAQMDGDHLNNCDYSCEMVKPQERCSWNVTDVPEKEWRISMKMLRESHQALFAHAYRRYQMQKPKWLLTEVPQQMLLCDTRGCMLNAMVTSLAPHSQCPVTVFVPLYCFTVLSHQRGGTMCSLSKNL